MYSRPIDTVFLSKFLTLFQMAFMAAVWLAFYRPRIERSRKGRYRLVGHGCNTGYSAASIKLTAAAMASFAAVCFVLPEPLGRNWLAGPLGCSFLWANVMILTEVTRLAARFRQALTLFALAHVPLGAGLLLGWAAFCGWVSFPMEASRVLSGGAAALFLYATLKRIPAS